MVTLHQLLKAAVQQGASDVHIVAGSPPVLRIDGDIVRIKSEDLTIEDCRKICYSALTDYQKSEFEENRELDFSFGVKRLARFRANLFMQRGAISGVFRQIPLHIPSFEELGVPRSIGDFTAFPNGLVLVTGPTGSGKSSTIAAIVDKINMEKKGHIITFEDPIEFLHDHKSCIVNQRELGGDTNDFKTAIKYVLRQDPDVVVLGELRDLDSIESAITIAETGHLVIATVHTNSAVQTINRLVNVFPSGQQDRIRLLLSFVMQGVISQRLLPSTSGGRVPAVEILWMNSNIRSLVRENKIHQVYGMMQVGQDKSNNMTLNQSLVNLMMKRKINPKDAFSIANDPEELDTMMKKMGV